MGAAAGRVFVSAVVVFSLVAAAATAGDDDEANARLDIVCGGGLNRFEWLESRMNLRTGNKHSRFSEGASDRASNLSRASWKRMPRARNPLNQGQAGVRAKVHGLESKRIHCGFETSVPVRVERLRRRARTAEWMRDERTE